MTAQRPVVSAFGLNHRLIAAIPPGWNLAEASSGGFRYLTVSKSHGPFGRTLLGGGWLGAAGPPGAGMF